MDFTSFMPGKGMDFIAVIGGPTVTAAGELSNYENRLHEHEQKHSPMSLYEMETLQNPHTFQRRLMNRMFTPHPNAAITSRGAEAQVTLFRRLTDSFKEAAFGSEK